MPFLEKIHRKACSGQCNQCDLGTNEAGHLHGIRLVMAAAGTFLLPLGLALTGAIIVRQNTAMGILAALIGLTLGIGFVVVASQTLRRASREGL